MTGVDRTGQDGDSGETVGKVCRRRARVFTARFRWALTCRWGRHGYDSEPSITTPTVVLWACNRCEYMTLAYPEATS